MERIGEKRQRGSLESHYEKCYLWATDPQSTGSMTIHTSDLSDEETERDGDGEAEAGLPVQTDRHDAMSVILDGLMGIEKIESLCHRFLEDHVRRT